MKNFFLVLVIVNFFSLNLHAQKSELIEILPVLEIKNKRFYNVLDHIIEHEKECDYYTSDLVFNISIRIYPKVTDIQISAVGKQKVKLGVEVGIFEYKDYLFIVSGEIDKTIFTITSSTKDYTFLVFKDYIDPETGEVIFMIIEDEFYSYWIYDYIDGEFKLVDITSICKE